MRGTVSAAVLPATLSAALISIVNNPSRLSASGDSDMTSWHDGCEKEQTPNPAASYCVLFRMKGRAGLIGHVYVQRPQPMPLPAAQTITGSQSESAPEVPLAAPTHSPRRLCRGGRLTGTGIGP